MELRKGLRLEQRFKIIASLGSSEIGNTYLAHDALKNDGLVVLKPLSQDKNFLERLKLTLEILRRSSPRTSNNVYEISEFDNKVVCVRNYVHGIDLQELVQKRKVSLNLAIDIFLHLGRRLQLLSNYALHLETLKLSDVIISGMGQVNLVDQAYLPLEENSRQEPKENLVANILGDFIAKVLPYLETARDPYQARAKARLRQLQQELSNSLSVPTWRYTARELNDILRETNCQDLVAGSTFLKITAIFLGLNLVFLALL